MARVALYLRVSTTGQTVGNQRLELEAWAGRAGHEVVAVYADEGISGAKGRDRRPEFDRMLKDAVRRRFDLLAAWSVDRLGRSLPDLVNALKELHGAGVGLPSAQQRQEGFHRAPVGQLRAGARSRRGGGLLAGLLGLRHVRVTRCRGCVAHLPPADRRC